MKVAKQSKATLKPKTFVNRLAEMGPTVSPTPRNELKYPEATLFSSSPFKCGRSYSILCSISGKIGTVTMHALKPSKSAPKKIVI